MVLGASSPAIAQDASPASESAGRNISLLRDLGLPEINLVATDTEVTGVPSELMAGRYLVTLENRTRDQRIGVYIIAVPDGTSDDEALHGMLDPGQPTWYYDATWAGGPVAGAGQTDGAVIELAAGSWWISIDRTAEASEPEDTATKLNVSGDMSAAGDIADAVPVTLTEYSFTLPATLATGPQIWAVTNIGAQPHFLGLAGLPDGTTLDQLAEAISMAFTGTPAASALSLEDIHDIYETSILSSGQTMWISVDLAPGTFGLACFLPDEETGAPHAMLGMMQVFTAS
jgi:hypothetical protein